MEEEVKNEAVVEEASVEATPVAEETTSKPAMEVPGNKFALIAFILSVVAIGAAFAWIGAFVGVIVGIVGMVFLKKAAADRKPFSVFQRVAKPLCIAAIIVGAIMFLISLIVIIAGAVAAVAAANNAEVALLAAIL